LLFSMQHVSVLIISHHQAPIKMCVGRILADDVEISAPRCLEVFC